MPRPQPAAQDDTLSELLKLINRQLTEKGLKVEKASAAAVDATIIQTAGSKQRQAIEVDEEGQVSGQTTPSQDSDAPWIKKNGLYKLGYKQHTRTDEEGYIGKLHITPANTHECKHLSPLLEGLQILPKQKHVLRFKTAQIPFVSRSNSAMLMGVWLFISTILSTRRTSCRVQSEKRRVVSVQSK